MLTSSVITLSVFAPNVYVAQALFSLAYDARGFAAAGIWSLPADVAPAHVASIGGTQNFASNLAGIVGPASALPKDRGPGISWARWFICL